MTEQQTIIPSEDRLTLLVGDYYNQTGKGCLPALFDLTTGKQKRRVSEISQLADIDEPDVMKIIASVNLICLGSKNKDEAGQKLYEAFMKGTSGGQRTGSQHTDTQIENVAKFSKIAFDQNWELREKRQNAKRAMSR